MLTLEIWLTKNDKLQFPLALIEPNRYILASLSSYKPLLQGLENYLSKNKKQTEESYQSLFIEKEVNKTNSSMKFFNSDLTALLGPQDSFRNSSSSEEIVGENILDLLKQDNTIQLSHKGENSIMNTKFGHEKNLVSMKIRNEHHKQSKEIIETYCARISDLEHTHIDKFMKFDIFQNQFCPNLSNFFTYVKCFQNLLRFKNDTSTKSADEFGIQYIKSNRLTDILKTLVLRDVFDEYSEQKNYKFSFLESYNNHNMFCSQMRDQALLESKTFLLNIYLENKQIELQELQKHDYEIRLRKLFLQEEALNLTKTSNFYAFIKIIDHLYSIKEIFADNLLNKTINYLTEITFYTILLQVIYTLKKINSNDEDMFNLMFLLLFHVKSHKLFIKNHQNQLKHISNEILLEIEDQQIKEAMNNELDDCVLTCKLIDNTKNDSTLISNASPQIQRFEDDRDEFPDFINQIYQNVDQLFVVDKITKSNIEIENRITKVVDKLHNIKNELPQHKQIFEWFQLIDVDKKDKKHVIPWMFDELEENKITQNIDKIYLDFTKHQHN